MSVDLKAIIIRCDCGVEDRQPLDSCALSLDGLKAESMLYTCASGEEQDEDELMEELYDDCYDEEDFDVEVEECYNGYDVIAAIAEFVQNNYSEDTMIVTYGMKDESFNELKHKLQEIDVAYQVTDMDEIFMERKIKNMKIEDLMERYGIQSNRMLTDSVISEAYFVGVLLNRIFDR